MIMFAAIALAIGLLASVFALGREIRLRRALEKLLHILLSRWRNRAAKRPDAINPDPTDLDDRV